MGANKPLALTALVNLRPTASRTWPFEVMAVEVPESILRLAIPAFLAASERDRFACSRHGAIADVFWSPL